METQMDAHSCCGNLPRWLRASTTWLGSSLENDTTREKQNRTKFGKVRKRGQEMGWVRDSVRKQRGIKTEDERGGRHAEIKRWEHRGGWRRTEEEESPFTGGGGAKMSLPSPLWTAHLHLPPGPTRHNTRPTEPLRWPWSAAETQTQTPLWAKPSDFQTCTKNPSGEPAFTSLVTVLSRRWFICPLMAAPAV